MKNTSLILLDSETKWVLLIIIIFSLVACSKKKEALHPSLDQAVNVEPTKEVPVECVTAYQLVKEYNDNAILADKKYKGKWIAVNGYTDGSNWNTSKSDTVILSLYANNDGNIGVTCEFPKGVSANLSKRVDNTIEGLCTGYDIGITLENCKVSKVFHKEFKQIMIVESAKKIMNAYKLNESSADKKYRDNIITISGIVATLYNDGDRETVVLEDSPTRCVFLQGTTSLSDLKRGSKILLSGVCRGLQNDELEMSNCEIRN